VQVLRVYSNGKEVVRTDAPGRDPIYKFNMPVQAGRRYLLVLEGDVGFPYGGYRGHPGLRCPSLPCLASSALWLCKRFLPRVLRVVVVPKVWPESSAFLLCRRPALFMCIRCQINGVTHSYDGSPITPGHARGQDFSLNPWQLILVTNSGIAHAIFQDRVCLSYINSLCLRILIWESRQEA
jgi:hypothetical protein